MCLAGEKFLADGDQATATAMKAIQDAAADEAKQRLAEKAAKKAAFNAEYDVGKPSCSLTALPSMVLISLSAIGLHCQRNWCLNSVGSHLEGSHGSLNTTVT